MQELVIMPTLYYCISSSSSIYLSLPVGTMARQHKFVTMNRIRVLALTENTNNNIRQEVGILFLFVFVSVISYVYFAYVFRKIGCSITISSKTYGKNIDMYQESL